MDAAPNLTYMLIDGENIDATLGQAVLLRKPEPGERPRWDRVMDFARRQWDQPVKALFFLNASGGTIPYSFVQALISFGYTVLPVAGTAGEKVVDMAIVKTMEALAERPGDVLLLSHDADFVPGMRALQDGQRKLGVVAFSEFVSGGFADLIANGLTVFDLEDDANAFNTRLNRIRIIPIQDFDPTRYL